MYGYMTIVITMAKLKRTILLGYNTATILTVGLTMTTLFVDFIRTINWFLFF